MNVLLTGGAGYIGSHTAKELARSGHRPVVLDNFSTGHRWAVRWGPLVEGDAGDCDLVRRTLATYHIDAVMHFAAKAYVGQSMTHPREYFRNNVVNALSLLDAMLQAGVEQIVFSSTSATYGVPQAETLGEDHPQRPINPYGESKLFVEKALHWYGEAYGLRWAVLRYFNAAGADGAAEVGEAHHPETHLIPLVLDVASERRRHVDIYGTNYATSDGTAVRDYIHVTDLARAHVRAAGLLAAGTESLALNLGTGRGYSVREVVAAAERVTSKRIRVHEAERRPGDPPVLVARAAKAVEVLGWAPLCSDLDNIVHTAWQWHCRPVPAEEVGNQIVSGVRRTPLGDRSTGWASLD
jgi:UDP-glucose-4-epimerase GalE